jgi:hypothetical protein
LILSNRYVHFWLAVTEKLMKLKSLLPWTNKYLHSNVNLIKIGVKLFSVFVWTLCFEGKIQTSNQLVTFSWRRTIFKKRRTIQLFKNFIENKFIKTISWKMPNMLKNPHDNQVIKNMEQTKVSFEHNILRMFYLFIFIRIFSQDEEKHLCTCLKNTPRFIWIWINKKILRILCSKDILVCSMFLVTWLSWVF